MTEYTYRSTIKSDISDEPINTYLLRPAAGLLVRALTRTDITPNQVTIAATISGLLAACCYWQGLPAWTAAAGILVTGKDLLDSADGQLARAKAMYSREGRFLDSIGDFVVNICIFTAIAVAMVRSGAGPGAVLACALGFLGISLRVSYHVLYQTSYLHLQGSYGLNRVSEELTATDLQQDRQTLALQRVFLLLYGWQDAFVARLDELCRRGTGKVDEQRWYGDPFAIRCSAFLGIGTELFLVTLFSIANRLDAYLWMNIGVMNLWWGFCVWYRRVVVRRKAIMRGEVPG
jgi:phosphatidylglycerophosphate synthase